MTTPIAKITHLFHSGYAVEIANYFFIFDYYQPLPNVTGTITDGIITADYLSTKKNVVIFVSHNHGDHFDPVILEWAKTNPNITYILSSDVKADTTNLNFHMLAAYEEFKLNELTIKTFGSTDQGISFLLKVDTCCIFHAGDLNWWHWSGESLIEQETAKSAFYHEMDKLAQGTTNIDIDIAFFPVDRRMGEFYAIGAEFFATKFKPKLLVPMHFGNDFATTKEFLEKAQALSINTVEITNKGQEIFF